MYDEPHRWLQAVENRILYVEKRLRGASPVVGLPYDDGAVLFTVCPHGQQKVYEVYDRLALGGLVGAAIGIWLALPWVAAAGPALGGLGVILLLHGLGLLPRSQLMLGISMALGGGGILLQRCCPRPPSATTRIRA